MKRILIAILAIGILLAACQKQKSNSQQTPQINIPERPESSPVSQQQMQNFVNKEVAIAVHLGDEHIIDEAAQVISLLRHTAVLTMQKQYDEALERLGKAIAKAKLIEKANNDKVLAQVTIGIEQGAKNATEAVQMIAKVDSLLKLGEIQNARKLLNKVSNEINIKKESVLIPEYLSTMKNAQKYLLKNDDVHTLAELRKILGKSHYEQSTIPLPLLRTQRLLNETEKLLQQDTLDTQQLNLLVDNANYEITFAEILGYGKPKADFSTLKNELKELSTAISEKDKKKASKHLNKIVSHLQTIRTDISNYQPLTN